MIIRATGSRLIGVRVQTSGFEPRNTRSPRRSIAKAGNTRKEHGRARRELREFTRIRIGDNSRNSRQRRFRRFSGYVGGAERTQPKQCRGVRPDVMKRIGICLICILTCPGFSRVAKASAAVSLQNPYEPIARRNIFGLLRPPNTDNEPPPTAIAGLRLKGTTSILGDRRALLIAQLPATPSEPAREQSLILSEGQSEGQITILEINVMAGRVTVDNYGTVQVLTFEKVSPDSSGTPTKAIRPPPPIQPPARQPR